MWQIGIPPWSGTRTANYPKGPRGSKVGMMDLHRYRMQRNASARWYVFLFSDNYSSVRYRTGCCEINVTLALTTQTKH